VEGQARDGLDLDGGEASKQKPHAGNDEHRQKIGHEDGKKKLYATGHVSQGSYAVTAILPNP
jgi:hypothetical protein